MLIPVFTSILEFCTILAVAYDQEGKWDKTWLILPGIVLIALHVAGSVIRPELPAWLHLIIIFLWLKCLYAGRPWKDVFWCSILGYAVVLLYLQAIFFIWMPQEWLIEIYGEYRGLTMNGLVFILCAGGILINRKWIRWDTHHLQKHPLCWLVLAAAAVMLCLFSTQRVVKAENYNIIAKWVSGTLLLVMLGAFVLFCMENRRQLAKVQEEYRQKMAKRDYRQHDFDKWIRLSETGQEVRAALIDEDDEREQILEGLDYTLESVLRQYAQDCENSQIELKITSTPQLPSWKPDKKDTCTIIGNLLENAIHAVQLLPEPRIIEVELCGGGNPFIQIRNAYDCTQKTNQGEGHGYGLKRAQNIAEKYGYSVRVERTENMFVAIILQQKTN